MRAYPSAMSTRPLFAFILMIAVLFVSALTGAAAASAATMPAHDSQMVQSGHCQEMPANSDQHGNAPGKSCCLSMCLAMAAVPASAPIDIADLNIQATYFAAPKTWHGFLGEIATPPPRSA